MGAAAVTAMVGALQLSAPTPAYAIAGLHREAGGPVSGFAATKSAYAVCPPGKSVLGGGAWISDGGRNQVRLTGLRPLGGPYFQATAETPRLQTTYSWSLTAYAICADRGALGSRYTITPAGTSAYSSARFKTAAAVCPSGTVAYGAGARIISPNGRVGLQLNRTSGPLDISRATARADSTYLGSWRVASTAVCASSRDGIHAAGQIRPGTFATATCSSGYSVHGPGGGGGLTDGGPSWLRKVYPTLDLRSVQVEMTGPIAGGMVAHTTCAR